MVKAPYIDSNGIKRGAWSKEEDNKLKAFVLAYGHKNWRLVAKYAGLSRCPKSCRLRWVNYLNPYIILRDFTKHEHDHILELHRQHGNKWCTIASYFPGRTDNDIKNYYNGHIDKRRRSKFAKKINIGKKGLILHDESVSSSIVSTDHSESFKTLSNAHLITESFSSKNFTISSTSSATGSYDSANVVEAAQENGSHDTAISYNDDHYSLDLWSESVDDADNFDFGISPLERERMMNSTAEESFWSDVFGDHVDNFDMFHGFS